MVFLLIASCGWMGGCSLRHGPISVAPPELLLGDFVDDYDNRFVISRTEWVQLPHGRFHIKRWDATRQYLIAQNDNANASAAGKWTRIDWAQLQGMPPYTWAFCLSAYDAPTAQAAERATIARRDSLRTGCNGYPFSRMRRLPPQ
jgi:hypothetical protein